MDFINLAKKRRSVRDFKKRDVADKDINYIIDAARWAPSANNLQNWRFIVVRDEEKKKKIAIACHSQSWMTDAPVLLVVCSLTKKITSQFPYRGDILAVQGVAAAIQNILLAATERGLASCWCAVTSEGKIRNTLQIPDEVDVHAVIAVGYANRRERVPSRIEASDLIFYEGWQAKEVNYTDNRSTETSKPLMERKAVKKLRKKLSRK